MRLRILSLVVVLAACSGSDATAPTSITPTDPPASSTVATDAPDTTSDSSVPDTSTTTTPLPPPDTTTTSQPTEEILYEYWKGSFQYRDGLQIDVHAPDDRSNHPIAVMVHGGGWFTGRLDSMGHLADGLAARGFVVFNATYRTIARGGSFPGMVEDVACAVAYAREHALDYSTTANHFTLIGHSAGAHLSSLVTFSPSTFGQACPGGDAGVDAWVGLAGSYDTETYAFLLAPLFGTPFADDPALWSTGNPYTYVDAVDPSVELLFVHGDADEIVPTSMTENLYLAADLAGASATLRILSGAGHGEVNSPRLVGDMIAELATLDQ
ncbi:MAG: alpha/beta hydrolase [Acidimicrobiia bacterium]